MMDRDHFRREALAFAIEAGKIAGIPQDPAAVLARAETYLDFLAPPAPPAVEPEAAPAPEIPPSVVTEPAAVPPPGPDATEVVPVTETAGDEAPPATE